MAALPCDSHVHSEFSWDTAVGDMEASCARAVELGLPGIAFTEHLDHTVWRIELSGPYAHRRLLETANAEGMLTPPPFDAAGYLAAIDQCRSVFPGLRILSGLEVGEPHWHPSEVAAVLSAGRFDRVLGSLHALPDQGVYAEPWGIYPHRDPDAVLREYLAAVVEMVTTTSGVFSVLAHIDYPLRSWPTPPFDPAPFEGDFRAALRATASSGRALEINTRLPLHESILRWWREEDGREVTFGSDAHEPLLVAHKFGPAAAMAESHGFHAPKDPNAPWTRT